jgi:hypothetical protein
VTEDDKAPRRDPIYEFQRWLMRNGARSVGRELKGTVSRTFGGGRQDAGDIWETATTEPPPGVGEAPECAWCPVCRAARRFRDSGPGIASHVAGAGDALLSVAQDTLSAFEATLSARPPSGHQSPEGTGWPGEPAGPAENAASAPAPVVPTGPPPPAPTRPPSAHNESPAAPAGPPPAAPAGPAAAPSATPAAPAGSPPAADGETPPAQPAATGPAPAEPTAPEPAESGPATAGVTETGPAGSGPSGAGAGPADGT